jgi:hypothetical protein
MKTLPSETKDTPKRQRRRFWLGCFTILLVLPVLLYYGYCWGLWGQHSLLFQYLFQCKCPFTSEERHYPVEVDIVVSAYRNANVRLSPSGRFLYVNEHRNTLASSYLLDLETHQKIEFAVQTDYIYFLSDDLVLFSLNYGGGEEYILDRSTGEQYRIPKFRSLHPEAVINGDADLSLLAEALRKAKHVFLINDIDTAVAITPDFPASPENNFITNRFDIPGEGPHRIRLFLQEYSISHQFISSNLPEDAVSPDGRFIAHPDGIYLIDTGERIVEGHFVRKFLSKQYFSVLGWTHDSSGVIYSKFPEPCLIEWGLGIEYHTCYYEVSQPRIKLKVPEEYLVPGATR